jgi:hypothetical protein
MMLLMTEALVSKTLEVCRKRKHQFRFDRSKQLTHSRNNGDADAERPPSIDDMHPIDQIAIKAIMHSAGLSEGDLWGYPPQQQKMRKRREVRLRDDWKLVYESNQNKYIHMLVPRWKRKKVSRVPMGPRIYLGETNKVVRLLLCHCHKMRKLPAEIRDLEELEVLNLYKCSELEALPPEIGRLSRLAEINPVEASQGNRTPPFSFENQP